MSNTGETTRDSTWTLLVGLIDRPVRTFTNIANDPRRRWILPVLLVVGAFFVGLALTGQQQVTAAIQQMRTQLAAQADQIPAAQMEQVQAQMARFTQPAVVLGLAAVTSLIGLVLALLTASAVLYFSALISGSDVPFTTVWAMVPWTWLPFALRDVVHGLYVQITGEMSIHRGFSGFVAGPDMTANAGNPLYLVLAQVDLFTLWHLVLVYALLRGGMRLTQGKALVLALVYAAISLALRAAPSLLVRGFIPGAG